MRHHGASMALLEIPTFPGVASYSIRVSLSGTDYEIRLDWRERAGAWYLSIYDTDSGEALAVGVRVVCGYPLLRHRSKARQAIPGQIWAWDLSDRGGETADLEDLGRRVVLTYEEPAEPTEPEVVTEGLGV